MTFQFPPQMLHVDILAGTILKFIEVYTYGTDPAHLEFHQVQSLGWYYHLGNDGMKEKKMSFENIVLYIKHPGLSNIRRIILSCLNINLKNFFLIGSEGGFGFLADPHLMNKHLVSTHVSDSMVKLVKVG